MRRWVTALAVVLLTGCAAIEELPFREKVTDEQIDQLISADQYGEALETLEGLPEEHTLKGRLPEVRRKAEAFAQARVRAARNHRFEGRWGQALQTLNDALLRYPQSSRLKAAQDKLEDEQQQLLTDLQRELEILEAEWQLQALDIKQRQAHIAPADREIAWSIDEIHRSLEQSFPVLKSCGLEALEANRLQRAEHCLELAQRIQPTPAVTSALGRVEEKRERARAAAVRREQERRERLREAQAASRRERADTLASTIAGLLEDDQLVKARERLNELNELEPDHPRLASLRHRVQETIAQRVETLVRQGNILYREGEIRLARDVWRTAVRLDPDHETARTHLQRVNRVLKNLRRLRQQGASPDK